GSSSAVRAPAARRPSARSRPPASRSRRSPTSRRSRTTVAARRSGAGSRGERMARYTGPVCRLCRREGMKLYLKGEKCVTKCTFEKRSSPPGMHQQRRRKVSDFALQLREKQKARRIYGVLEKQMKNTFDKRSEERRVG